MKFNVLELSVVFLVAVSDNRGENRTKRRQKTETQKTGHRTV